MTAMEVDCLITEVSKINEFIQKQSDSGRSITSIVSAQAASLAEKIRSLRAIDISKATELIDQIEGGMWDASQLESLCAAVNGAVIDAEKVGTKRGNKALQRNLHIENYLNASDWESIVSAGVSLHFVMRFLFKTLSPH